MIRADMLLTGCEECIFGSYRNCKQTGCRHYRESKGGRKR